MYNFIHPYLWLAHRGFKSGFTGVRFLYYLSLYSVFESQTLEEEEEMLTPETGCSYQLIDTG